MTLKFLQPIKVASKIRIGRNWDGGYVLEKESLQKIDVAYSYGVGWEVSFEKALFKESKVPIRIFDPTMFDLTTLVENKNKGLYKLIKYLAKVVYFKTYLAVLPLLGYRIKFHNQGLAVERRDKYDSFTNHLQQFGDVGKKILLKIDIEGGEYEVFRDDRFIQSLTNVVQIAIEFHDLQDSLNEVKACIERLKNNFSIVHIHANNYGGVFELDGTKIPRVIELTFLNNRYAPQQGLDKSPFPDPKLDYPNRPLYPDIALSHLFM